MGALSLFWEGKLSPNLAQCGLGRAYLHIKWHTSRLATIDMGLKIGGSAPFLGGELGPHLTHSRLGRGLRPYQVAS